nr:unnamed protein product [Digitaria exilis]
MDDDASFAAAVRRRAASSDPSLITFHTLPRIDDPPEMPIDERFLLGYFELVRRYKNGLLELLRSMPPRSIHAVVMDALSNEALDVAKEMGVPAYTFFAWSASALAVFLQLSVAASVCDEGRPVSFKELGDSHLDLLGVPPMPASHLSREMLEDPNGEIYQAWMSSIGKNLEANGMLVNTFVSLEARALGALNDPQFLPGCEFTMPPVYAVGPLLVEGPPSGDTKEKHGHECLAWLDSVVFLCFGSVGCHSEEQLKEIAVGLERSGHRFLWVVRAPVRDSTLALHADPDLDALLPEGFLERTNGHGLVVKEWAPQVDVLHHKAIGVAGVPMLCWPLYAEQKMNKVVMVEEFGVGVEVVVECRQQGLVKAEEVEAKVTLVLESQEGERLRARMRALKEAAAMSWNQEGGSSRTAFGQFLLDLEGVGIGQ